MLETRRLIFTIFAVVLLAAVSAQAQVFRVGNEFQVRSLLTRLETKTDAFRTAVDRRAGRLGVDSTNQGSISTFVSEFEDATDRLRTSFNARRSTIDEATEVLNRAWYIDNHIRQNRAGAGVERQWASIRTDLDALARYYTVAWNWDRARPPFDRDVPSGDRLGDLNQAEMRELLARLETNTDEFRHRFAGRFDDSRRPTSGSQGSITAYIAEFENATDELRSNFNANRATANDATEVLNTGWYIDDYMRQNRLGAEAEREWREIRADLDMLARNYNVAWNWTRTTPPFPRDRWSRNRFDRNITGTYRLNASLSDNVRTEIDHALGTGITDRQRDNLERRLSSPEHLAIEMRGNSVSIATNLAQTVSFTADGRAISETNARGRTTQTTVSSTGSTLTITTKGDRSNDYWVSFTPVGRDRLRVTRGIYLEGRNETVTATSVYDRVSNVATWPPVDRRPDLNTGTAASGTFLIPNGTRLTAILRDRIVSNVSQIGDRFTMEVTSPARYRGALITGRVVDASSSGRVTGRANIGLDFETISMNGQTYTFAGIIDSARETDGDIIRVSNEGTVRDSNQTTRTVTRAGIGAVLGALIGAIAGGGEGAAIGAGVGAGAGAGSVLLQGRDNIDLQAGSEFTITATAPGNVVGRY